MKQLITATASLILILSVFGNMLCLQEIKMKQTELNVISIKYIELLKKEGKLDDSAKDEWASKAAKIFKCDKADIDITCIDCADTNLHKNKIIEVNICCNIKSIKSNFGIEKGQNTIKAHYEVKCGK